jgi:hypothetical protein
MTDSNTELPGALLPSVEPKAVVERADCLGQPMIGTPEIVQTPTSWPDTATVASAILQEPAFLTRARRVLSGDIRPDDYLCPPDELVREVEAHYQRVAEESGVVASDEARRRTLADWTLSHYYGGQLVLRRLTDQRVIVLAVGPNEVGAVEEVFGVDARSGFVREIPYVE